MSLSKLKVLRIQKKTITKLHQIKNPELDFSTGIDDLDLLLGGLRKGDNVVIKIENIDEYIPLALSFGKKSKEEKKNLIYFRFAQHKSIIPESLDAYTYKLSPSNGFEKLISQIVEVINEFGHGACYVFDSISELSVDWYSDVMVANFFMLICPYLYNYDTIAYFALFRNHHELSTVNNIQNTAQIVIEIYNSKQLLYLQLVKVDDRITPNMFLLHEITFNKDSSINISPITESAYTAKIMINKVQSWLGFHGKILDIWYLTFKQAQESLNDVLGNKITPNQLELFKSRLLQMAVIREDMLLSIAIQYMSLSDLLDIGKRMIGTGYIGGKAVGLLLAQAILKKKNSKWMEKLEFQDNYFIGCEVYYTYLVINDFWWKRRKLSNPKTFLQNLEETKKEFLYGNFPRNIVEQFLSMLNYYGQSPIIVRSSSLQEDAYGNSFSGKYESVFLSNQGSIEKRLDNFLTAVRKIYASTISIDALTYRKARNLIEKDEQMALVIQRVSGDIYDHYFLPQVAGTGFSYNPYIWNEKIDPHSGFLRLVLGLGTRAVDRTDSDFTRLVAINQPLLSPLLDPRDKRKYSQQKIDLLDLRDNEFKSIKIDDLIQEIPDFPIEKLAIRDFDMENRMYSYSGKRTTFWIYDFEPLLKNTTFLDDMKEILKELEKVYNNPVDIEYTVNFFNEKDYTINLLQCRPFQVKINASNIDLSEDIPQDSILLETHGPIIGPSLLTNIDRIIYIQPDKYAALSMQDRYAIARLVGKLNNHRSSLNKKILLMGPGRWGTSSPSLGIPVNFAEINHITAMCEMVEMHSGLIPDISLGSHFFNNLVELDILYFGFSPNQEKTFLKREFFINHPNRLSHLIPEEKKWENIIYVIDGPIGSSKTPIRLLMNVVDQQGFCYLKND